MTKLVRGIRSLLLALILVSCAMAESTEEVGFLEQSVCGLKEPLIFWLWSNTAGDPDETRIAGLKNAESITVQSRDGRTLRGYRLKASSGKPKAYLLVLQGNAILADQILGDFQSYSALDTDVYIIDFRGYGRSDGKRRIKAMVDDVKTIIQWLNGKNYDHGMVYAMSFGGILMMNAFTAELNIRRIVIDSSPSRLSNYGCPTDYDPINHLPDDCTQFMFITGAQDPVIPPAMSAEMTKRAGQCNATLHNDKEFSHPFLDQSLTIHQRRFSLIESFLRQPKD